MPWVEVKLFDHRLREGVAERIVAGITDALVAACGEEVRERTEVVIQGIPPARWGFAGTITNQKEANQQ